MCWSLCPDSRPSAHNELEGDGVQRMHLLSGAAQAPVMGLITTAPVVFALQKPMVRFIAPVQTFTRGSRTSPDPALTGVQLIRDLFGATTSSLMIPSSPIHVSLVIENSSSSLRRDRIESSGPAPPGSLHECTGPLWDEFSGLDVDHEEAAFGAGGKHMF